jgi:hypothetical protein
VRAISGENPNEFVRYVTVKERSFPPRGLTDPKNDDFDEYDMM